MFPFNRFGLPRNPHGYPPFPLCVKTVNLISDEVRIIKPQHIMRKSFSILQGILKQ